MTELEMYNKISDKVMELVDFYDEWMSEWSCYPSCYPKIEFQPMTLDAAQCHYEFIELEEVRGKVIFNSHVIPMNYKMYMNVVVPHEVSHWCHALMFGFINDEEMNENHGFTWTQMMEFFEADPTPRMFNMKSPVVKGLYHYGCKCCTVNLSKKEVDEYAFDLYCPNCNQEYKFITKGK